MDCRRCPLVELHLTPQGRAARASCGPPCLVVGHTLQPGCRRRPRQSRSCVGEACLRPGTSVNHARLLASGLEAMCSCGCSLRQLPVLSGGAGRGWRGCGAGGGALSWRGKPGGALQHALRRGVGRRGRGVTEVRGCRGQMGVRAAGLQVIERVPAWRAAREGSPSGTTRAAEQQCRARRPAQGACPASSTLSSLLPGGIRASSKQQLNGPACTLLPSLPVPSLSRPGWG